MTPLYPKMSRSLLLWSTWKEKHWTKQKQSWKKLGLNVTEAGTEISDSYEKGQIIFSYLSEEDFKDLQASTSDSDGIIDQLRITKGVEAAVFLYPIKDGYKVSMRSNETVNVSEIAKSHGGGGHIRAAGCSVKGNLQDVKNMIINDITKQL